MKKIIAALLFAMMMSPMIAVAGDGDKTLNGSYVWNREAEAPGDLKAVFSKTGEGEYNVSFYFKFRDQDYTYTGTAKGSLENGDLSGKVTNEGKNRNWTFTGKSKDGVFNGEHTEVNRRGEKKTGTFKLS